jgi:hypothetical protein
MIAKTILFGLLSRDSGIFAAKRGFAGLIKLLA